MTEDYKLKVDWHGIEDMYASAGINISDMVAPYDESLMIKCDDHCYCYDSICTTATSYDDEHKAKIKELEAENSKLKAKIEELVEAIEHCKKNGIWTEE